MQSKYTFGGQYFRYQFVFAFLIALITYILIRKSISQSNSSTIFFHSFLILTCFAGIVNLWIHPKIVVHDNGISIIRLGVLERRLKWKEVRLKKKIRTITRYGTIGLDPRYALFVLKKSTFFDKYVILLPFTSKYNETVNFIEKNLNKDDVYSDKDY